MNKYNQIQRKEFQHLRVLIEAILGINVRDEQSRKQEVVNARMIYANILKEQGFGCSVIAKSIRKTHATVIHYFKQFEWYTQSDDQLNNNFKRIKREYRKEYDPIQEMSDAELKKELSSLRTENKKLYSEQQFLTLELTEEKKKNKRLYSIFSLIEERTKIGSEDDVLRKLNTFYNGVYDY